MTRTTWLEIEPADTLFFRGAESMEAGENHEADTIIMVPIRTGVL